MKRLIILISFLFITVEIFSQNEIKDCLKNFFKKIDSVTKTGRDPFEVWKKCVIGQKLPAFVLKTYSGDTIRSAELEGRVIVINFWFIDCHPCIAEMPGLNKLVREFKNKDVVFLAPTWETEQRVKNNFLDKHQLDFKIIPDARSFIDKVMASGYPTTYIIDKNGVVNDAFNGGLTNEKASEEFFNKSKPIIDKLLAE